MGGCAGEEGGAREGPARAHGVLQGGSPWQPQRDARPAGSREHDEPRPGGRHPGQPRGREQAEGLGHAGAAARGTSEASDPWATLRADKTWPVPGESMPAGGEAAGWKQFLENVKFGRDATGDLYVDYFV